MVDFTGNLSRTIKSGAFPDPDVGTPRLPSAAVQPYPPGPWNPVGASPPLSPFERVGGLGLPVFGVDANNPDNIGDAQNSSLLQGKSQLLNASPGAIPRQVQGNVSRQIQDDWFEHIIVFPGELDVGNVLSTQIRDLVVLNNYRHDARLWVSFDNNVGQGITVVGLPTLPTFVPSLQEILLQVTISSQGPPTISGTLDFVFDVTLAQVTVTGTRVILFPYEPQTPVREELEFLTDLMVSADGVEQRASLRNGPRQSILMTVRDGPDIERDALNALLFDWQARLFGVPIWWEVSLLLADTIIGGSIVEVDTAFADYRVGGLVSLGTVYNDFETFEIVTINPMSIEIKGEISLEHPARQTLVMPVRLCYADTNIDQNRFYTGLTDTAIKFISIDNTNLSDSSAFGSYNSKVLIDRPNKVSGSTVKEGLTRALERMDSGTGNPEQRSIWTKSKPRLALGLDGDSMQETWEIRQLLHFLSGRRVSFYLGTGRSDIKPVLDMPDNAGQIDFRYIDFVNFYQEFTPRSDIQITRKDGTKSQHTIIGSTVVDPQLVERITISPVITPALPLAELDRVEFLSLSRLDSDKVTITHNRVGDSVFRMPTRGIFG